MLRRKPMGAALVALATVSTLALANSPAEADFSPQPKDVVSTGSDIIQNSFNFLADGYAELPGYNTAGNRYRFVNFDSSGDAQGRSAFTDPRLTAFQWVYNNAIITPAQYEALSAAEKLNATKYIKPSDLRLLNPTISLQAGKPLVVRPSGGGAGGRDAIIADKVEGGIGGWIDIGRSPNTLTTPNQNLADTNLGTKLFTVQVATDRQLMATATTTNAPTALTADAIYKIYKGEITTWGQIDGWGTAAVPGSDASKAGETIVPIILPTDAGMWTIFVTNVDKQITSAVVGSADLRANPNRIEAQQNDPTSITSLPAAQRANAIMPFPRGRFNTLATGYYTQTKEFEGSLATPKTNTYNTDTGHRTAASNDGIKLLDFASQTDVASPTAPYGGNFPYNAFIRATDVNSPTPWQPGSTLNWAQALFYNPDPDGPLPFVRTPAGIALLQAAGVTPDYKVFGTDNGPVDLD